MLIIIHRAQGFSPQTELPGRFGVEIDVRDYRGMCVMSHDPAVGEEMNFDLWLENDIEKNGIRPLYAINIKCDGIEEQVGEIISRYGIQDCAFVFDMSFPTQRRFEALGVPIAERMSEEEQFGYRHSRCWLDRWDWLHDFPIAENVIWDGRRKSISNPVTDKFGHRVKVYAVSPELHVPMSLEKIEKYWMVMVDLKADGICTDYFLHAEKFFAELESGK
jgi:hypothetical protein